jgi:hypothetical protein
MGFATGLRGDAEDDSVFDGESNLALLAWILVPFLLTAVATMGAVLNLVFVLWETRARAMYCKRYPAVAAAALSLLCTLPYYAMLSFMSGCTAPGIMREMWLYQVALVVHAFAIVNLMLFGCVRLRSAPLHLGINAGMQVVLGWTLLLFEIEYGEDTTALCAVWLNFMGVSMLACVPMFLHNIEVTTWEDCVDTDDDSMNEPGTPPPNEGAPITSVNPTDSGSDLEDHERAYQPPSATIDGIGLAISEKPPSSKQD